jgi:hypothetical protein
MQKRTGQILKSDQIELEGKFQLNPQNQMNKSRQNNAAPSPPQVRILENTPEYAVLGLTCSCGAETSIRCDYADTQTNENSQT